MEDIRGKGLENGGNPLKAMRKGLLMENHRPARGKARQGTAAPVAAGEMGRGHGAAVAVAISLAATQGCQLVAAYLPHSRHRQQQGAEKRQPNQQGSSPDTSHIFCINI